MKKSSGEKIFNVFNISFLIILSVTWLYPFLNILAISLNDAKDTLRGGITVFPRVFTLINYQIVFGGSNIMHALFISSARTLIGTLATLFCTSMVAYVFTKKGLLFKKGIITYFLIPMFISGGLIPYFLVIKTLGLMNNFLVYIIPGLFDFYSAIIIRVYFQSNIHESISESAFLDGATDFTVFFKIYVPLSKPILAAMALFIGVSFWNEWMASMLYCANNHNLWTLQYLLQKLVMEAQNALNYATTTGKILHRNINADAITPQSITYATLLVATIPIICIYPFLQRYFISGIMLGSIKG